jgi:hypothetical protein
VLTRNITHHEYPKEFKSVSITKYNGKQDPRQWLRCYSMAIEVLGGVNTTKVIYFPMALESAPLTWLESLKPDCQKPITTQSRSKTEKTRI